MPFRFWKQLSKQDGRFFPGISVKVMLDLKVKFTKGPKSVNVAFFESDITLSCQIEECFLIKCAGLFSA